MKNFCVILRQPYGYNRYEQWFETYEEAAGACFQVMTAKARYMLPGEAKEFRGWVYDDKGRPVERMWFQGEQRKAVVKSEQYKW